MERKDLIAKNVPIMAEHGRALAKCAREGVRVLVVANPACTNCLIVSKRKESLGYVKKLYGGLWIAWLVSPKRLWPMDGLVQC